MNREASPLEIIQMLSEAGSLLLSSDDASLVIKKALSDIGNMLGLDRVYICKNYEEKDSGRSYFYIQMEWVREEALSLIANERSRKVYYDIFPRWHSVLSSGETFSGNIADFPSDEKLSLELFHIKTLASVPILFQGFFWGFIAFNTCRVERVFEDIEKNALSLYSVMLGSYIIRQKIADDIKYNEERLYKALEGSGEGVWDLDFSTFKIYMSDKGKAMIGVPEFYNMENIPVEQLNERVLPEDIWAIGDLFERYAESDEPIVSHPFRFRSTNDRPRWITIRGSVRKRDTQGKPLRAIGTFVDITEKLEMENKLKEALSAAENANKAKSSFLATMSHEIRTPLNGMIGFLRLLVEHVSDGTGQEYLRIINNSTGTLLNIINSILDISKVESGSMALDCTDCNIVDEMEAIGRLFSASAYEKRVYLHTFIDSKIPLTIKCDQQRIRQIISNLLNNALKFTAMGGFIYLEAVVVGSNDENVEIKFSIKDTGIGISDEYLKDIFKPFTQADSSVSRKYGGSGLGLTIAYKFIELMGGELKIKSKVGSGSDFYFTLTFPVVDEGKELQYAQGLQIAYIEYPKSSFDFERNLKATGGETIGFESFEDLLCYDLSNVYALVFSVFYTNQGILNDIQVMKNKYPSLPILLVTYPVDVSIFDVLNSLKIKTKIRPFSVRKMHSIILSMRSSDAVVEEEVDDNEKLEFAGKVLVAEDNAVNCKLISILLAKYGMETTIVVNGQEALSKMKEDVYDIILMDVNMPVMDGMTATKEIRRREALAGTKRTPVIALTANVLKEDAKEFLAAGMDHVLTKPIIPKELEDVFKKYMQH